MSDQNEAARTHECLDEISTFINGPEILPHLIKHRVLVCRDDGEFLLNDSVTKEEKGKRLLSILDNKPNGFCLFIQCLQDDEQHLGHRYLSVLLRESTFASDDVLSASSTVKERMVEMADSMKDLDIDAIVPFLRREELLTESEFHLLLNVNESRHNKILNLLSWLDTKGPTAYYLFACCLRGETDHPTRKELFDKITTGLSPQFFDKPDSVPPLISKVPVEDKLKTAAYLDTIKKLRRLHLDGKWDEADLLVDECITYSIDVRTAILLESCTGWITRRQVGKVFSCVEKAREMCQEIGSNNSTALEGRCDWALAKLYRYMNNNEKALEHIRKAIEIQLFVEDGEDRALTLYCYGSIQLALHAMKSDTKKAGVARTALQQAITNASLDDYGLDLSHPKIRLAQACLGSSPFKSGNAVDRESIASAKCALADVNIETLAPRSKCIYLFTQSDVYRNEGDVESAVQCAESALHIATDNGFQTELISVQNRLKCLHGPANDHERVDALIHGHTLSHTLGLSLSATTRSHFLTQQNRRYVAHRVGSYKKKARSNPIHARYLKTVRMSRAAKYRTKVKYLL